ncbi:hypothetical protein BD779DRAFT_1477284 [Infundibulicybe gibba]|nr:hypothetical protein BD779DRAFT_1477284 [Infundibulicybe gibba]
MAARKLLVMDLNGCLIFRSPPKPHRTLHPRPYMPTFRHYLFHPTTRAWLDAMIWSSAQPQNVAKMVNKCFPCASERQNFLAVWSRHEMGLPVEQYNKKTQTVKDLEKVWAHLKTGGALPHSQLSTILMDDSATKAALQPHKHLIVRGYDESLRRSDLRAYQVTARPAGTLRTYSGVFGSAPARPHGYDQTLIAVVGILEQIKTLQDVEAWFRVGGPSLPHDEGRNPLSHDKGQDPRVWFEDESSMEYWVGHGRRVLEDLHISIEDGLSIP